MRFGILLLCLIVLLLLTAVLPVGKGLDATAVYTSPVMILLLALLSGSSVWCSFKKCLGRARSPSGPSSPGAPQRTARRAVPTYLIGFLFVHLGVVAILAGAFIGYVAGTKGTLQLSLTPPRPVGRLLMQEGDAVEFGFNVAAENFEVKFYPPLYHLYRQLPPEEITPGQMPFGKVAEYDAAGKDFLEIEGLGRIAVSNLWNKAAGEWAQRRMLDAGSFLHRASQTPSHFGVMLKIDDHGQRLDLPISINHPAGYKGWRFYLMSYDQMKRSYVVLSARRDPGRGAVITGIWMLIAGTFVLCFRRQAGPGCDAREVRYVSQASSLPLETGTEDEGGAA